MDDTRLIVEVEKQKVIYDPKNLMYKDLQAKEKAWMQWIDHLIIHEVTNE